MINEINREDMLELTRRMTLSRNCFSRIVGAYFDEDGYVDGTFNTHFQKLSKPDQEKNLQIAKAIPFARSNVELKQYSFPEKSRTPGSVFNFLKGALDAEFKNDAIFDLFYEMFGERYQKGNDYAIYFFLGNYDVKLKGTDKKELGESESVYRFMICSICPVSGDYEPGQPEAGFIYPAYNGSGYFPNRINVFNGEKYPLLLDILGVE